MNSLEAFCWKPFFRKFLMTYELVIGKRVSLHPPNSCASPTCLSGVLPRRSQHQRDETMRLRGLGTNMCSKWLYITRVVTNLLPWATKSYHTLAFSEIATFFLFRRQNFQLPKGKSPYNESKIPPSNPPVFFRAPAKKWVSLGPDEISHFFGQLQAKIWNLQQNSRDEKTRNWCQPLAWNNNHRNKLLCILFSRQGDQYRKDWVFQLSFTCRLMAPFCANFAGETLDIQAGKVLKAWCKFVHWCMMPGWSSRWAIG